MNPRHPDNGGAALPGGVRGLHALRPIQQNCRRSRITKRGYGHGRGVWSRRASCSRKTSGSWWRTAWRATGSPAEAASRRADWRVAATPRASVVVPVLNDAAALHLLLADLRRDESLTVVVVDGGSSDDSVAVAKAGADLVCESPPSRGGQLRLGADRAADDWLWFLHADTRISPAALAAFGDVRAGDGWGWFDVRLSGAAWPLRVVEAAMNRRAAATAVATGDHGIFVHRRLLDAVGGVPPLPLMEDVALCKGCGASPSRAVRTRASRPRRGAGNAMAWCAPSARCGHCVFATSSASRRRPWRRATTATGLPAEQAEREAAGHLRPRAGLRACQDALGQGHRQAGSARGASGTACVDDGQPRCAERRVRSGALARWPLSGDARVAAADAGAPATRRRSWRAHVGGVCRRRERGRRLRRAAARCQLRCFRPQCAGGRGPGARARRGRRLLPDRDERAAPELFADIPWSTDAVLAETIKAASRLSVVLLETLWDVDVAADLQRWRAMQETRGAEAGAVGR